MAPRLASFILLIVILLIGSFVLWGDFFEDLLLNEKLHTPSPEAALFAILLLWADPLLPIPVTVILTTLGAAYGFWIGLIIGIWGTMGSGILAYGLCRMVPEYATSRMIGGKGVAEGKYLILKHGGWAIAFSRWMAILPEVLSALAGLLRMPLKMYIIAMLCGIVPMTTVYVWLGTTDLMQQHPRLGLVVSAGLPVVLWLVFRKFSNIRVKIQD
jgi:uncharacterized membrane protein YdjX (TVP38/TMEM64 family)